MPLPVKKHFFHIHFNHTKQGPVNQANLFSMFDLTSESTYYFPEQSEPHQATWLQWPHSHTYGQQYEKSLQRTWVDFSKALSQSQIVRIIVYDQNHREYVSSLLQGLYNIQFYVFQTDDVWVRDNGPIFVRDRYGELIIEHWGFNGWGKKAKFTQCEKIPKKIASTLGFKLIDLTGEMVNEGGSVEIDGKGVMMVCESSTLNKNRNNLEKYDAEKIFQTYYGVKKIIWLKGKKNGDITDCHIDGFLKFVNSSTMITFTEEDLKYWGLNNQDINTIYSATNLSGQPYQIIQMPLTKKQLYLSRTNENLKGSYINFYIANRVVLVPQYDDENDGVALEIIQRLYSNRQVVGVNVVNLFNNGGMIHCVTQQQPVRQL